MIDSIDALLGRLRGGTLKEHLATNLELKTSWHQSHGKDLCALANRLEQPIGWMVVGVRPDGTPAGHDETWAEQNEERVSQHVNQYLDPVQSCCEIRCEETPGGWLLVIAVKNPGEVVYWNEKAYVASGTTHRELAPPEALELRLRLPGLTDYSRQTVVTDCRDDRVRAFAAALAERGAPEPKAVEESEPARLLEGLGIAGKQVSRILFGDCQYRVVKYDRGGEPLSNETRVGLYGLLQGVFRDEVQEWAAAGLRTGLTPYSDRALREGTANAVAHAAYFENDGEVIVELHPERAEISNLCLPESRYFANRWFSRSHKTVNGLLMEVLRIGGYVDELGRGKSLIFAQSLQRGTAAPEVRVEKAGRYDRWRLILPGGDSDENLLRLLERSRTIYGNEQKALIAQALVLWRDKPVSEIRSYVDGDFSRRFAEVLASLKGPIFYFQKEDRIVLHRWARVLLEEGQDSKTLGPEEEEQLKEFAFEHHTRFFGGYITPRELRERAGMANSASEQVLSSGILKKWCDDGTLEKVARGRYKFKPRPLQGDVLERLLELFESEPPGR